MQIRNLSETDVPRLLWRAIAQAMNLDGLLPQARRGEWPVYYGGRSLHVTVNRRTMRGRSEGEVVCGAYSLGNIYLYPCPRCTAGFLTFVFLHEICHAWLDAFHAKKHLMRESCGLCDTFAHRAFKLLGGERSRTVKCWKHRLPRRIATENLRRFEAYLNAFASADSRSVAKMMKGGRS